MSIFIFHLLKRTLLNFIDLHALFLLVRWNRALKPSLKPFADIFFTSGFVLQGTPGVCGLWVTSGILAHL